MATTRSQSIGQITWTAANTVSIPADGIAVTSDDFQVSTDMVAISFTISGNSAGTASNDIIELHYQIKKDPNLSNGGVPDTYDTAQTFKLTLDCSDGADNQQTELLNKVMAGDIMRFSCSNDGTNAIVIGISITEDEISF